MAPERNEAEMRDTDMAPGDRRAQERHEQMRAPNAAERREFAEAHAEGLHEIAREFCPECEAEGRRA